MKRDTLLRSSRVGAHPPITAEECQQMLDRLPTKQWSGGDGGFTTPAPKGRRTWWFGDSITVDGFKHSTNLIQTDGLLTHPRGQVIPNVPNSNVVYWPAYGTVLSDETLLIICGGIIPTPTFFEFAPMTAAICTVADSGKVTFSRWTSDWKNEPLNGNASRRWQGVVRDPSTDILWLFATPAETNTGFSKGVFVCSVPESQIETPSAWSEPSLIVPYETDGSWSPWIDEDTGKWHSLSMSDDKASILAYTASNPLGPWTKEIHPNPVVLDGTEGELIYVAHAHPWLTTIDDRLICTVSHSATDDDDPWAYRIRFFDIPRPSSVDPWAWSTPYPGVGSILYNDSSGISATQLSAGVARLTWDGTIFTPSTPEPGVVRITW